MENMHVEPEKHIVVPESFTNNPEEEEHTDRVTPETLDMLIRETLEQHTQTDMLIVEQKIKDALRSRRDTVEIATSCLAQPTWIISRLQDMIHVDQILLDGDLDVIQFRLTL